MALTSILAYLAGWASPGSLQPGCRFFRHIPSPSTRVAFEPEDTPKFLQDKAIRGSMTDLFYETLGVESASFSFGGPNFLDTHGYFFDNVFGDLSTTARLIITVSADLNYRCGCRGYVIHDRPLPVPPTSLSARTFSLVPLLPLTPRHRMVMRCILISEYRSVERHQLGAPHRCVSRMPPVI